MKKRNKKGYVKVLDKHLIYIPSILLFCLLFLSSCWALSVSFSWKKKLNEVTYSWEEMLFFYLPCVKGWEAEMYVCITVSK